RANRVVRAARRARAPPPDRGARPPAAGGGIGMGDRNRTWLRRHPIVVLLAVNVVLFGFLLLAAEIFLRLWVPYNPGYYVAVRGTSKEVEYPYGVIKINRDGFPDI